MNYGHNQQKKSNAKKVGVVDGEVVMEDCLAYGRVQVRTDVLSTSRDEIEVPQVYEAIWQIINLLCSNLLYWSFLVVIAFNVLLKFNNVVVKLNYII